MRDQWSKIKKLDGQWELYIEENRNFKKIGINPKTEKELKKLNFLHIKGSVPGNFELDMEKEGLLPDLMKGLGSLELQKLENRHLWYCVKFDNMFEDLDNCLLRFHGIDTFSEIYLNGNLIGETENMFIKHEIKAEGLRVGENELVVHIKPTCIEGRKYKVEAGITAHQRINSFSLNVRKAPHMFGWDIMPRAVSGGLWRSVELVCKAEEYFEDMYMYTAALRPTNAVVFINYQLHIVGDDIKEYFLEFEGVCKESKFISKFRLWNTSGRHGITVHNPKLWWTKDMGEPNLYEVTVKLYHGDELIGQETRKLGIRHVELVRKGNTGEGNKGEFLFKLNGKPLFVRGTNWVPLDAFHSRDPQRLPKALSLLDEVGCNMVRCWGGNVYETDDFFDFCDEHGIAVWQDFAMACAIYPNDQRILSEFNNEAEIIIKELRQHPSLFLWAGDNECDMFYLYSAVPLNPNSNKITREIFPEAIRRLDPMRLVTYLPSSPYIDEEAYVNYQKGKMPPEDHLWGERGYYKAPFYADNNCKFASEIGYFGCPEPKSMKKFLSTDKIWPWQDNDEWLYYAINPDISNEAEFRYITGTIEKQIIALFGEAPGNLGEYTLASQITQAEAFKFFIEHFRINRGDKTGIMCWNLIDGWPQTSNGYVDYYFEKKLCFHTIKTAQLPISLSFDEAKNGKLTLIGMNDHLIEKHVKYEVFDLSNDELLIQGDAILSGNANTVLNELDYDGAQRCYKIVWSYDGKTEQNHYLAGEPNFDLKTVAAYYEKLGICDLNKFV